MRAWKIAAAAGGIAIAGAAAVGVRIWLAPKTPITDGPAAPRTVDQKPATVARVVHWTVAYRDSVLGDIEGTATVDWAKRHASVTLADPAGGKKVLSADDVQIDRTDTLVTMRLRGASPSAPATEPPSVEGVAPVAVGADQQVAISNTDPAFSTTVKDKARADADGVRLVLEAGPFGSLSGEWSYRADPITERNANKTGRIGYFRLLNADEIDNPHGGFLGEQSGVEEWWPLPTEIACTVVLEEQLAASTGFAMYPFPTDRDFGGGSSESALTRTLFVVGRNFPVDRERVLEDVRGDTSAAPVDYQVLAVSTDPNLDSKYQKMLDAGWATVTQALDGDVQALAHQHLDAAVVRATLKRGAVAGPQTFTWGGAESAWFLQFGDNFATARFIRPLPASAERQRIDAFEVAPSVFLPESLIVEVDTPSALPLDTLPVRIAARRNAAHPQTFQARRVEAGRYRTDPFWITQEGKPPSGAPAISLQSGDELLATVAVDDVKFVAPPEARASVLLTPDQIGRATGGTAPVALWKDALVTAAKIDGVSTDDLSAIAGHHLAPYKGVPVVAYNTVITAMAASNPTMMAQISDWRQSGISMTVADHAAMLLLRTTFVGVLQQQLTWLNSIKTNDDVDAFHEWLKPFLRVQPAPPSAEKPSYGHTPYAWMDDALEHVEGMNQLIDWLASQPVHGVKEGLEWLNRGRSRNGVIPPFGEGTYFGELSVTGPGGGSWKFYRAYADPGAGATSPFFHDSRVLFHDWQLRATREVLTQYKAAVAEAIASAQSIAPGDIHGLLRLTGIGFEPVVDRLMPQLMRLDDSGGTLRWVPDVRARAAVSNLHLFAAAARAGEDYAGAKLEAMVKIGAALVIPVMPGLPTPASLVLDDAGAEAAASLAGHGIMAWQIGSEIVDRFVTWSDIDVFFGQSAVLGVGRVEEERLRKSDMGMVILNLATQFAIDDVRNDLIEATSPIAVPGRASIEGIGLPGEARLLAAEPAPTLLRRLRGFASRIGTALGRISAERVLGRMRNISFAHLKLWAKPQIERFLRLAGRAGERVEAGLPVSKLQLEAQYESNRLNHELAGSSAAGAPFELEEESGGAPPPGKGGFAGLEEEEPAPKQPVAPKLPAAVALPADLPHVQAPPLEGEASIVLRENFTDGDGVVKERVVRFRTPGDENGVPKSLGGGATSQVYRVKGAAGRSTKIIAPDKTLTNVEDTVLKFIQGHKDFGTAAEQIARIKESNERLKNTGIEHAEILEIHEDARDLQGRPMPYLIQRRLKFNGDTLKQVNIYDLVDKIQDPEHPDDPKKFIYRPKPYDRVCQFFPVPMQKAVLQLYRKIADANLMAADLSIPNIYFKRVGNIWIAGILDIDHIAGSKTDRAFKKDGLIHEVDKEYWYHSPSREVDGRRAAAKPMTFMEKALEARWGGNGRLGWIKFIPTSATTGRFVANFIDPELVREFFTEFRSKLESPPPKKQSRLDRARRWLESLNDWVSPQPALAWVG